MKIGKRKGIEAKVRRKHGVITSTYKHNNT
jgi:hypothetical protein